jgi:hypothetical protein
MDCAKTAGKVGDRGASLWTRIGGSPPASALRVEGVGCAIFYRRLIYVRGGRFRNHSGGQVVSI